MLLSPILLAVGLFPGFRFVCLIRPLKPSTTYFDSLVNVPLPWFGMPLPAITIDFLLHSGNLYLHSLFTTNKYDLGNS